jgi:putative ABC transport system permease protein
MFRNYLNITYRNILRKKAFSFINILGLSIGISIFILIILFVRNERSYDRFHENYDRIYRLVTGNPRDKTSYAGTPAPLGPAMLNNFPEVINYVRMTRTRGVIKYKDKIYHEKRIFMVDSSIFEVFTFSLIKGDSRNALKDYNSIILTKSMANKYFDDENPIGKMLNLDNEDFLVTAIVKDVPENSHIHFDFLVPFVRIGNLEEWGAFNYHTYILLQKNIPPHEIKEKFIEYVGNFDKANIFRTLNFEALYYQPLSQIHFQYNRKNLEPSFNGVYIKFFIGIAITVLILACINFTNLSTAHSSTRAKEIGIRKTIGATKLALIKQFMSESTLFVCIASIIALIIVEITLPWLNNFSGKNISVDYSNPVIILGLLGIIIFTGILAGCYPAFIISSFNTVKSLKGTLGGKSLPVFTNILVIFQFAVSIILIINTILISRQINFINKMDLGLNKNHVINIRLNEDILDKTSEMKSEFLKIPEVISASKNGYVPSNMNWNQGVWWRRQHESERTGMWIVAIDKDFLDTLEIKMAEGKDMLKSYISTNKDAYVLNKSALKQIGWQTAIGKEFSIYGEEKPGVVIGVTEDFHFRSLHHEVAPLVMLVRDSGWQISLRVISTNLSATLNSIRKIWREFAQDFEFDYYFLDEDFDKLYKSEIKLSQLLILFTMLSVFIACIGMFGLVSLLTQQKTKEIGIRKVLGASVLRITYGLTSVFVRLVLIANLIALPVAYYTMNKWLENFAYHTNISLFIFILALAISIFITFMTVSYQSIKAAIANPVDSLRYE